MSAGKEISPALLLNGQGHFLLDCLWDRKEGVKGMKSGNIMKVSTMKQSDNNWSSDGPWM